MKFTNFVAQATICRANIVEVCDSIPIPRGWTQKDGPDDWDAYVTHGILNSLSSDADEIANRPSPPHKLTDHTDTEA